jgi:hypothetical protein
MTKIPPIQINMNTAFGESLTIISWIEFRFTFYQFKAGGWFSSPHFAPQRSAEIITINPLKLGIWFAHQTDDMKAKLFPVLTNETIDEVYDNLEEGSAWLKDLGQWETVNAHQWTGNQPIQRKGSSGQVVETEPAMWDIAAPADAERILVYRGHNSRDEVYSLNVRLNQFCDYWRNMVDPIYDEVKEMLEMADSDDVDADEYRSKRGELYNYILDNYRENPPPWD